MDELKHIGADMMSRGIRLSGVALRALLPSYNERLFRFCNRVLDTLWRGRPFTRKLAYREEYVERGDGTRLRLCVYSPRVLDAPAAGLLWLHGGGFAIGVPEQDAAYYKAFEGVSGCVTVAPDYRRSTEAPYPAAFDDCYLALLWLRDNAARLGVDISRIAVGGNSAGGGLTAAVTLAARDRGDVDIVCQLPLYPMLDDRPTASSRANDAPVWNTASNDEAWRLYLGESRGAASVSKYAAPARETELSGLPPTVTFVGDIEPFTDETVSYVSALRSAGVKVDFKLYKGCFHAFDTVCPRSSEARDARSFMLERFAEYVGHNNQNREDGK